MTRYHVAVGGRPFVVDLRDDGATLVDATPFVADLSRVEGTDVRSLLLDGASHRIVAQKRDRGVWDIHLGGRRYPCEAVDERTHLIRKMSGSGADRSGTKPIRAPMPGLVVKIEVRVGDRVSAGQGVVTMEAMKMENELRAETAGTVAEVLVAAGQTVEKDQILIALEAVEPPAVAASES